MDYHGDHCIVFIIDLNTCIKTKQKVFKGIVLNIIHRIIYYYIINSNLIIYFFYIFYTNYLFFRYTLTEDKKILSCMENKENEKKPHKNLVKLSKILNRSQHSIWLRYKLLTEQMKNNKKCKFFLVKL